MKFNKCLKPFILILGIIITINSNLAAQKKMVDEIAFTTSFTHHKTDVVNVFYREPIHTISGSGTNLGLNLTYNRTIIKPIYIIAGLGYTKINFDIRRAFLYPFDRWYGADYHTKKYSYNCIDLMAGVGIRQAITKKIDLNGAAIFHKLSTVRQIYVPETTTSMATEPRADLNKNYHFGTSINLQGGLMYYFTNDLKIGLDLIYQIGTKWKKDELFGEDNTTFFSPKFAGGIALSIKYNVQALMGKTTN